MSNKEYKIPSSGTGSQHLGAAIKALQALEEHPDNKLNTLPNTQDVEMMTALFKVHAEWWAKERFKNSQDVILLEEWERQYEYAINSLRNVLTKIKDQYGSQFSNELMSEIEHAFKFSNIQK